MEKIEMIVKLTLARLEIIKLMRANGGYDWSMVDKDGKKLIEDALIEIDELLKQLKRQ